MFCKKRRLGRRSDWIIFLMVFEKDFKGDGKGFCFLGTEKGLFRMTLGRVVLGYEY